MGGTGVPLLDTKLHLPRRRPGVVARARLDRRLDRDALPPVTVVSAPAGFGKTTLLAQWVGSDDDERGTAWLSLDRRDSDPAVFWSYVVAALRTVDPDLGADALAALRSSPSDLDTVVATLVNDVAALGRDVAFVLDDYHVIESVDVHQSMLFLVEHLPAQLRLVVATRADPPWPLARLRARGDLLEIRAADLRFSGGEAAAYLNGTMGLDLPAAHIDALEDRTEGWIAALQLAALSLQGRADPASFIAGFSGDDRFVVDYLVDEVLDRQPESIRSFLLDTSILDRLTASLCGAVAERRDAKVILDAIERSNLFLVPLDDRRQWYRYHHLFGDVLRARLTDEHLHRAVELHRRACDWFEAHGGRAEAIRHAMAAKDFDRAAELIELAIPEWSRARQESTLRDHLDALPADVFDTRPVLSLGLVGARMATGDTDGVEALLDVIDGWLEPGRVRADMVVHDHAAFRRLPAEAAMYRAALALLRGNLPGTIACAERAALLSEADDHLGLGAAAALVGLARWTDGDLPAAERGYVAAISAFERAGRLADVLGCSLGRADIQAAQGRLGAAQRTLTAALGIAAANGHLRGTADMHVGLSELHLERNDLAAAAEHLRLSLELGERLALRQHAHRWRVVEARLLAAAGDYAGALDLLGEAEQRYDTDYSPPVRPVTATTARVRLAAGDLDRAEQWAHGSGLAADDACTYLREYEHLTFARVLVTSERCSDAVALLERLHAAADAGGRTGSAVEAQLLLALAHQAASDTPKALAAIEGALTRAQGEGLVRVFLDAGAPMLALLRSAVRHGRAAAQATAILAAAAGPPSAPSRRGLVEELSSRELDVLRLLRSELTGPEIAGELVVSLNTVRTHTKSIFTKLGVNNRRAAVRRADELGL